MMAIGGRAGLWATLRDICGGNASVCLVVRGLVEHDDIILERTSERASERGASLDSSVGRSVAGLTN